jgi:hypothetical protein
VWCGCEIATPHTFFFSNRAACKVPFIIDKLGLIKLTNQVEHAII